MGLLSFFIGLNVVLAGLNFGLWLGTGNLLCLGVGVLGAITAAMGLWVQDELDA